MSDETQRLAALVGSRICHDLISPVGAIQNGVELLAMEGRAGPEMALIEDSVKNASARIRYMRVAFGLAGVAQPISRAEVMGTLADMSRAGRVRYDWTLDKDCLRADAQQVFLAMMCLESAMPRGGTIVARGIDDGWAITGPAEMDRPNAEMWGLLQGQAEADPLPAHVQYAMLPLVLKTHQRHLTVTPGDTSVTLRITPNG
ncbi:histidine phosphotransferase family protein [Pseudooceanicola sp. MF1-13]|uniref:histidine phosphotransferase family protein n=1 Tax=Pseudooceanicola sp. MF1-13 TaxID=3379095 RepID=UPI003891CFA2